eukprot:scaffold249338_cov36-Tisochrysis_lutea.AAC.3
MGMPRSIIVSRWPGVMNGGKTQCWVGRDGTHPVHPLVLKPASVRASPTPSIRGGCNASRSGALLARAAAAPQTAPQYTIRGNT